MSIGPNRSTVTIITNHDTDVTEAVVVNLTYNLPDIPVTDFDRPYVIDIVTATYDTREIGYDETPWSVRLLGWRATANGRDGRQKERQSVILGRRITQEFLSNAGIDYHTDVAALIPSVEVAAE